MAENDNKEPIIKRLAEFLNYKGLNALQLANQLGYNSSEKISRLFRKDGTKPSADIIEDITNKFEELNANWWMTGKGNMLLSSEFPLVQKQVPNVVVTNDKGKEQIIWMDSKAAAGFPQHINDRDFYKKLPTLKIPKVTADNATVICVQISGDSMSPTLKHDQWVVAKFEEDIFNNIRGGDICLIVTVNDGVMCKRVYPDRKTGVIECVSDNEDYRAFDLQPNEYLQIYKYVCDINFSPRNINNDLAKEVRQLSKRLNLIEKKLEV